MASMTSLVWFRDDLRTFDHPALHAAVDHAVTSQGSQGSQESDDGASSEPAGVVALYVLDEESDGLRPLGGAVKWWLHQSLIALREKLEALGIPLVLRRGAAHDIVLHVVETFDVDFVGWNRRYGGPERAVDAGIKEALVERDVEAHSYAANLLFEPWTITTGGGTPYRVFTPFWKACLSEPEPREPLDAPSALTPPSALVEQAGQASDDLDTWALLPTKPDWSTGIARAWTPGEDAAHELLADFLDDAVVHYATQRDEPSKPATSRLSPHLRFGEISPQTIWHAARRSGKDVETFLSELGWREFAWHTLYEHPDLAEVNLNRKFDAFPWPPLDEEALVAWEKGETGVPLVDAGMRELWETGTMHNRVRMVVASFLTKNLLIDWRIGEEWFWDTLVDADTASNPFNWQWVAGCGADAAPYFRVFNPETQRKKFDPDGRYVRRWGADDGREPIVDLAETRMAALAAYEHTK